MSSLIRAANLNGIEELMAQLDGDATALLTRHHIEPALIHDPGAYVPYKSVAIVLESGAAECKCTDFGLRLAQWQGLNMLGPVAVIARNSSDVEDAFGSLARYLYVHGPALKLSLRERNAAGDYCFDYRIDAPGLVHLAQSYELSIANGVQILRFLAGQAAHPARVYFRHAPLSSRTTYARFLGCQVEFQASHCGFDLRAADMQRPLQSADAETLHLAQRFLESSQPANSQISERVRELIHRLLATGQCSIAAIAEQIAMHPRTLQRALESSGTHYEDLLDEIRRDKARHYLAETVMRFSQIAGVLGYSDQSTFNRACRRWFNRTPKELRRELKYQRQSTTAATKSQ